MIITIMDSFGTQILEAQVIIFQQAYEREEEELKCILKTSLSNSLIRQ